MNDTYGPLGAAIHELRERTRDLIKRAPRELVPDLERCDAALREAEGRAEFLSVIAGEHDQNETNR